MVRVKEVLIICIVSISAVLAKDTPGTTTSTELADVDTTIPTTTLATTSTTSSSTTNTTTTSTTTTSPSPPAPTPTPAPTPPPGPPTPGSWAVSNSTTNVTCLILQATLSIQINYTKTDNSTGNATVNVPGAADAEGACGALEQWLRVQWGADNASALALHFATNLTSGLYHLAALDLTLAPAYFPNASWSGGLNARFAGRAWEAPLAKSYRCAPPRSLALDDGLVANVSLTVSALHEQAFRTDKGSAFSTARDCSGGGDVPDAVPIAVGCALGGLVLVVLAAYLLGRRRSHARGYLSM